MTPSSSKTKASSLPCGRPLRVPLSKASTQIAAWKEKLEHFQVQEQLNRSDAREKIAEVIIANSGNHFTPQELVKEVQKLYPNIGVATVYRNIPVLVQAGIIRESLATDSGHAIYEADDEEHHDHVICLDCQAIFEFHDEEIEALQNKITTKMNFKPVRHRHVIYAHCAFKK